MNEASGPGDGKAKSEIVRELTGRTPFDRVDREHLEWMASRLQPRHYPPGTAILSPGVAPEHLHFIWSGTVRLEAMGDVASERRVLAELVEGESFPLEALHERRPIFSTFRAVTDTWCYELGMEEFGALQEMSPAFRGFCEQRSRSFLENSRRIYTAHFAHEPGLASQVSKLMVEPRATCGPATPLRQALAAMRGAGAGGARSVVVLGPERAPLGIFGVDDLLQRVASGGDLDAPMSACMRPIAASVAPEELAGEAALAMARAGREEVLVVDGGRLVGVVSERQLFDLQRVGVGEIGAAIRVASAIPALARAAQDVQVLAYNLMAQGVAAAQLTRLVSTLDDRITERIVELEVARAGISDLSFCWIAFGSEGRLEQTLWTDQDNGIVFDPGPGGDAEAIRARLLPVAQRINAALADCGFPLCKGKVMAGNPECCLSADEWSHRFTRWIERPGPEELLKASIFFDLRPVWGRRELVERLQERLLRLAPTSGRFLGLLAQSALARTAPIGFFRDFVVDAGGDHPGTLDLKLRGITLFVDAARVLAIGNGITAPGTGRRLHQAGERLRISQSDVDGWVEAFHFVQVLRLRHQHELVRGGKKPHNRIDPHALNPLDRRFFLESLRQATRLQKRVATEYGVGAGM